MTSTTEQIVGYRPGTWVLDPAGSRVAFTVRHLALGRVRGVFRRFDVLVDAPGDPLGAAVDATIDVASLDTGMPKRDAHLLSSRFLAADAHPRIEFRSTALHLDSASAFRLEGDLTLHGETRPIALDGAFEGVDADAGGVVRATARFDRRDFGVRWNPVLEAGGMTVGTAVHATLDLRFVHRGGPDR